MNLEYIQAILPALLKGTWQTLQVFFLTLVLSLPLGLPFALGSISRFFPVRFLSKAYIWAVSYTHLDVYKRQAIYMSLVDFERKVIDCLEAAIAFGQMFDRYHVFASIPVCYALSAFPC